MKNSANCLFVSLSTAAANFPAVPYVYPSSFLIGAERKIERRTDDVVTIPVTPLESHAILKFCASLCAMWILAAGLPIRIEENFDVVKVIWQKSRLAKHTINLTFLHFYECNCTLKSNEYLPTVKISSKCDCCCCIYYCERKRFSQSDNKSTTRTRFIFLWDMMLFSFSRRLSAFKSGWIHFLSFHRGKFSTFFVVCYSFLSGKFGRGKWRFKDGLCRMESKLLVLY